MNCPCGNKISYEKCCGKYIAGVEQAPTPEHLMRARYTAYTLAEVGFLKESYDPRFRKDFDEKAATQWSKQSKWLGLEVLRCEGGGKNERQGTVEFIARYSVEGKEYPHHEIAEFRKDEGDERWYFVDGVAPKKSPVKRDEPKIGRNDPCPCGSGKKHKKCCGN